MGNWIASWAYEAMHAGIQGSGASDAWHSTVIEKEFAAAVGLIFSGTSLDVHKCFDQNVRAVRYFVAMLAGCPTRVLTAYFADLETCLIRRAHRLGTSATLWHSTGLPHEHDVHRLTHVALGHANAKARSDTKNIG